MRMIVLMIALLLPVTAHAYIGPGLGLGAVGVVLGAVVSFLLAIVAIVWYPFKRLLKKFRKSGDETDATVTDETKG